MTNETISLNQKFRKLLMRVEGTSIGRKQLIELAENLFKLSKIQAQRLVARNIHALTTKDLIVATGENNARVYLITPELLVILQKSEYEKTTKTHVVEGTSSNELMTEEIKTSTELKIILGEIQAYQDYLEQFPQKNKTILSLLNKTRDHASDLYGRLSAINKIIKATEIEDNITC
ncbi:hypothetical protein [Shewanella phaeophyticola]|uniref:Transcriptional regulator VspR n=1 Tax=Shewanella phaeophyticola TaxID=2978345 RepID=A0ABT2P4P6_9GAMM|nr:hypothetical protein [Shewanella sp. KJ10-1]MCT8986365.1 hypothetical protein [Shewanella sp. KJ10-1]